VTVSAFVLILGAIWWRLSSVADENREAQVAHLRASEDGKSRIETGSAASGISPGNESDRSVDADMPASTQVPVRGSQLQTRDSEINESRELNDDQDAKSDNRIGEVTPASIQNFVHHCPGQVIPDCAAVSALARRIASSGGEADDGWPEWMENEIEASLTSVAQENRFIEHKAKCNVEGCVFYFAGKTSREIFQTGFTQWDEFQDWLTKQPWTDQLAENRTTGGSLSVFAWRVFGTGYSPFVIWYVVRRIPLE